MTCWKCSRELAGHWARCPYCSATSLENAEAIARGVASCAVEVDNDDVGYWAEGADQLPGAGRETRWAAEVCGQVEYAATRHGAALAAFDAAWTAGRDRLMDADIVTAVTGDVVRELTREPRTRERFKVRRLPSADDPWHAHRSWIGDALMRKASDLAKAGEAKRRARPRVRIENGLAFWVDDAERDPVRSADEDREPPAFRREYMGEPSTHPAHCECGDAECPGSVPKPACGVCGKAGLHECAPRAITPVDPDYYGTPEPDPQAIVDAWCEATDSTFYADEGGARLSFATGGGLVGIAHRNPNWLYFDHRAGWTDGDGDRFAWFRERALYCGIPAHVADAMVALAREALS